MDSWTNFLLVSLALVGVFFQSVDARERGEPRDPNSIVGIVLHSIGGPACVNGNVHYDEIPQRDDDADFWRNYLARAKTDVHYIVGRSGNTEELIPEDQIAYHVSGNNSQTIGIEIVNSGNGVEPFTARQVLALVSLIRDIRIRHPQIALGNIVTHAMLDQRTCNCAGTEYPRRPDPGTAFPFDELIAAISKPGELNTNLRSDLEMIAGPAESRFCVTR